MGDGDLALGKNMGEGIGIRILDANNVIMEWMISS